MAPVSRRKSLDGLEGWIAERFRQHAGNADVVRQELAAEKGVVVSLRTVERAVAPLRQELRAEARATVRFETRPGQQLQIDVGERRVWIGDAQEKVFFFVATLGYAHRAPAAHPHDAAADPATAVNSARKRPQTELHAQGYEPTPHMW